MALSEKATSVATGVNTQGIGFAPIIKYYLERCGIEAVIDDRVPADARRRTLTHGQTAAAMITAIFFQVMQLYRICRSADETTVLNVIYPEIMPSEYFDDRLGDTLDALMVSGLGNPEFEITRYMMDVFGIKSGICHNETASASYFGKAGHENDPAGLRITFGHSKKHREDLKQLVWSMSVSSDSAFPLFQQAYNGSTADVTAYVEQRHRLIDLLGRKDFLSVGGCRVITAKNIAAICGGEGFFPAPDSGPCKIAFDKALSDHSQEMLIPYKDRSIRGFEAPFQITWEAEDYDLRMIILYDPALGGRKRRTLERRIGKTRNDFDELEKKLNKRNLKTRGKIETECAAILKKRRVSGIFTFEIVNEPAVTVKNRRRGRPSKNAPAETVKIMTDCFRVHLHLDEKACEKERERCGCYPPVTNRSASSLSIKDAMPAHKGQYKNEHTFRRGKSECDLEPIYPHSPDRIEAYLFLFKTALQILVLIERTARQNIQDRDRGLDDFMPNRKDVRNPKTERLLEKFQYAVAGHIPGTDGTRAGFVSELTELQLDILSILEVPPSCYSYQYVFDSG